jgi:hypothetical protein
MSGRREGPTADEGWRSPIGTLGFVVAAAVAKIAVVLGTVTIGPITPVCRVGVPCDRAAARVTLTFTRLDQSFATTTDDGGVYRIRLRPGIYTVRASAGMSMRPRAVNVRAPETKLDFAVDTGIR